METISYRALRDDSATIVARVAAGESFTVTRRGIPIADLVPHDPHPRPDLAFTPAADVIAAFAGTGEPDSRARLDDIRAATECIGDEPRDPWRARTVQPHRSDSGGPPQG